MSTAKDMISAEIKTAMKSRDKERLGTLRLIKNEILKKETEKGATELDDQGLIRLLQSMKKQRLESIAAFQQGGREELAAAEQAEIDIIVTFLPSQLDDEALATLVDEVVAELGVTQMKEMGKAIKEAMARAAGQADGKRVSAAVKQRISA